MNRFSRLLVGGREAVGLPIAIRDRAARDAELGYPREEHICPLPNVGSEDLYRPTREDPLPAVERADLTPFEHEIVGRAELETERLLHRFDPPMKKLVLDAGRLLDELLREANRYLVLDQEHRERGFRSPIRWLPRPLYRLILFAVGAAEYPTNLSAFLIFRMTNIETNLLAVGPSVIIPLVAHFTGTAFRQKRSRLAATLFLLGGIITLCAITYLRAQYVAYQNGGSIDWRQAGALLALNQALFFAGICAAFAAHDSDPAIEQISSELRVKARTVRRARKRYNLVAAQFNTRRARLVHKIEAVRSRARIRIDHYRDHLSRTARHALPPSFRRPFGPSDFLPRWIEPEIGYLVQTPLPDITGAFGESILSEMRHRYAAGGGNGRPDVSDATNGQGAP